MHTRIAPRFATFPWTIKINGQDAHSFNANRISLLIPKPGEIEHWTYINGGGGWDHPIHLHFEEGITMDRARRDPIPGDREAGQEGRLATAPDGTGVTFQMQFGEYGGSYVNHCHNTVHEDFAMLMRIQLLTGSRVAAGRGHADAEPDARRRALHDAGDLARRRPQIIGRVTSSL